MTALDRQEGICSSLIRGTNGAVKTALIPCGSGSRRTRACA